MQQENLGSPTSPRYPGQSGFLKPGADAGMTAIFAPRILLVDPDPLTRALLVDYLRDKGFDILAAAEMAASPPPVDVLIIALDSMGQRASRSKGIPEKPGIPTIVLDRSHVFPGRAAAIGFVPDARLSLPIQPRKLVATIRQVLSLARTESLDPDEKPVRIYRFSGWTLHCHEHRLESHDGKSILLDKREFEVLRAFLTYPRQLLTRQQLIAIAWGADMKVESRRLDRPITRLRRHLGDDVKFPAFLKTVVGVGYRLDVEVEKSF